MVNHWHMFFCRIHRSYGSTGIYDIMIRSTTTVLQYLWSLEYKGFTIIQIIGYIRNVSNLQLHFIWIFINCWQQDDLFNFRSLSQQADSHKRCFWNVCTPYRSQIPEFKSEPFFKHSRQSWINGCFSKVKRDTVVWIIHQSHFSCELLLFHMRLYE